MLLQGALFSPYSGSTTRARTWSGSPVQGCWGWHGAGQSPEQEAPSLGTNPGLPHPAELSLAPLLAQGEPSSHRDHLWDAAPRGCECCCRPRQPPARAWPHTAPEHLQKGWSSKAQSSQQRRGEKSPNKWQLPESTRENATGLTSAG